MLKAIHQQSRERHDTHTAGEDLLNALDGKQRTHSTRARRMTRRASDVSCMSDASQKSAAGKARRVRTEPSPSAGRKGITISSVGIILSNALGVVS